MSDVHSVITYCGRSLGIVILTAIQTLIGSMHAFFGAWLLVAGSQANFVASAPSPEIYSVYTLVFGLFILVFTGGLWLGKSWGWSGTVAVSLFVIAADSLTLLNFPSIPGIPKSAAVPEIIYSLVILLYFFQTHVRIKYKIFK